MSLNPHKMSYSQVGPSGLSASPQVVQAGSGPSAPEAGTAALQHERGKDRRLRPAGSSPPECTCDCFQRFYVFPEPPWSLMNSGGGDCLACSTKCSETWARWPVRGGRASSVTASPLLRRLSSPLSACSRRWFPSRRAASYASSRGCDVSKCHTAGCCCRLLRPMVCIRGKNN